MEWRGQWFPAEVVEVKGDRRLIHYTGYGDEWNEWVGPERLRAAEAEEPLATTDSPAAAPDSLERSQPQPGDFVVQWGERWWRAQVLQQDGDKALIRYVGYGPEWDEWVTPERAKIFTDADSQAEKKLSLDSLSGELLAAESSAPFRVEWQGHWYPATVLDQRDGQYLIHYEGYGDDWNEWIKPDRLQAPPKTR